MIWTRTIVGRIPEIMISAGSREISAVSAGSEPRFTSVARASATKMGPSNAAIPLDEAGTVFTPLILWDRHCKSDSN